MEDLEHGAPAARVSDAWVGGRAPELVDPDVALAVGVVDVELPRAREVRSRRHSEQAPLSIAGQSEGCDVEERSRLRDALHDEANRAPFSATSSREGSPGMPATSTGALNGPASASVVRV